MFEIIFSAPKFGSELKRFRETEMSDALQEKISQLENLIEETYHMFAQDIEKLSKIPGKNL